MNLLNRIPGDFNISLAFTILTVIFLTLYMGFRTVKRFTFLNMLVFTLQLFIATTGFLSFVNKVIVIPAFELALILFGFMFPVMFLAYDYIAMKKRIRKSNSNAPLIEKKVKESKKNWKYNDFIEKADEWKQEIQANALSSTLRYSDKHIKTNMIHQINMAHKHIENGELGKALDIYRILSGIMNDNPFVLYNTAWLLMKNDMPEEASKLYKKALFALDNDYGEPVENKERKNSRYNVSSADMEMFKATFHFGYGLCFYILKKYEHAIHHFTMAKKHAADLVQADSNIARCYIAIGNLDEAERHLKRAIEIKDDTGLRFLMARICFEKNHDMECKYHLEKIVETENDFAEAWDLLGKVYRNSGDWSSAVNAYKKLTQILPQDAEHYYRLGLALRHDGKTDDAFSNFKFASEIQPDHSRALYSMASILDADGKYDKAIECLKKSLEGYEKLEMAYNLLAEIYISIDRVNDAIHVYDEASIQYPDSYVVFYNLGVSLMMMKRYDEAVRSFKRANKLKSDDPALYYNWASAAISLKDYNEAVKLYKEGLKFKPDDDEILFGLARVSALSGDIEATMAFLAKAFEINPELRLRAKASLDFSAIRTLPEFMDLTRLPAREERKHA